MSKIFNRVDVVNKIDLLFERLNRINEAEIELREDLGDLRAYCYTAQIDDRNSTKDEICPHYGKEIINRYTGESEVIHHCRCEGKL